MKWRKENLAISILESLSRENSCLMERGNLQGAIYCCLSRALLVSSYKPEMSLGKSGVDGESALCHSTRVSCLLALEESGHTFSVCALLPLVQLALVLVVMKISPHRTQNVSPSSCN